MDNARRIREALCMFFVVAPAVFPRTVFLNCLQLQTDKQENRKKRKRRAPGNDNDVFNSLFLNSREQSKYEKYMIENHPASSDPHQWEEVDHGTFERTRELSCRI